MLHSLAGASQDFQQLLTPLLSPTCCWGPVHCNLRHPTEEEFAGLLHPTAFRVLCSLELFCSSWCAKHLSEMLHLVWEVWDKWSSSQAVGIVPL